MTCLRLLATFIMLGALPNLVLAQTDSRGLAKCAATVSPADRLECYDALAGALGVAERKVSTTAIAGTGDWKVSIETSPIDDSRNVFLMLDSKESVSTIGGPNHPTLVLRCKEKKTTAYIAWGTYLGLDETTVLTRLDDQPAARSEWNISTDREATFHRSPVAFAKSLLGKQRFLAQVTPYGENPALVTFAISGLDEALKPLRSACGW